jgi:hypothetical protein
MKLSGPRCEALQEHADMSRRAATHAHAHGLRRAAEHFERAAIDNEQRADLVRGVLSKGE